MYKFLPSWPPFSQRPEDIEKLYGRSPLGLDLEFSGDRPTILGLSDGETHISVPWYDGRPYLIELLTKYPDTMIIGHNFLNADFPLLIKSGIPLKLENIDDSIVWWYLTQQHLCKSSGKSALDEEGGSERRGRGFMNLWSMASVHTDYAHWKDCRGEACEGPCPAPETGPHRCPNWRPENEFYYNSLDSAAPVIAMPKMKRQAQLRGVDKLYSMHAKLMYVLAQIQDYGVKVDVPYIQELDAQFTRDKEAIEQGLPFNPKSPKAVVEYFKQYELRDAQETTVRELVEELGDGAPTELVNLLDYKELGNGAGRWFAEQYRDERGYLQGYRDIDGYIHGRLNPFTSSGRLAMSSPNLQNVGNKRGEQMRRAIISPPGWYIAKFDYANAENRVVLWEGGYDIPRDLDLHVWVGEMSGLTADMDLVKYQKGGSDAKRIRQAAKSIQHANNILEGLKLRSEEELRSKRTRQEIDAGALIVFPKWRFHGKIVTFTGSNLSRRVYGDATWEHRRTALDISKKYFDRFPGVREFQQRVSKRCEIEGMVRTRFGYAILSFGDDTDRMKISQGIQQQNPIAHIMKLTLLRLWDRWERDGLMRPVLSVHDECLCYVKDSVTPETALGWLQEDAEFETPEMPKLIVPIDSSYGMSWADSDQKTLDKLVTGYHNDNYV